MRTVRATGTTGSKPILPEKTQAKRQRHFLTQACSHTTEVTVPGKAYRTVFSTDKQRYWLGAS